MSETVTGNDGVAIPLASCALTLTYSDGFVSTATLVYAGQIYVQTFTNNGTNVTAFSQWNNLVYPNYTQIVTSPDRNPMIASGGGNNPLVLG